VSEHFCLFCGSPSSQSASSGISGNKTESEAKVAKEGRFSRVRDGMVTRVLVPRSPNQKRTLSRVLWRLFVIGVVAVGIVTVVTEGIREAVERKATRDRYARNQANFHQLEIIFSEHPTEKQILGIMGASDWTVNGIGTDNIALAGPLEKGEKDLWWNTGESGLAKGVRVDNAGQGKYIFQRYQIYVPASQGSKDN